jgi:hypothetical protein
MDADLLTVPLACSEIYDLLVERDIDIPRMGKPDREAGARAIGIELSRLFKKADGEGVIETDGFIIHQTHESKRRPDNKGCFDQKKYSFAQCDSATTPCLEEGQMAFPPNTSGSNSPVTPAIPARVKTF